MAWFPGAIRKEIARHDTLIIGPRRYTLHTAVSAGASLFNYFNQPGNPTSHFYVRADGTVEQYVSTAYRAPAQLEGNHDSISVETQDMGGPFPAWTGSNVPAWTPQQVEALARIGAWLHTTHRIKLQLCPSSRPRTEGFAFHRQGIDPWRVPDGELWSKARGKVCPGDRRVKQVPTVLARAKTIVEEGDDDMFTDEDREILRRLNSVIASNSDEKVQRPDRDSTAGMRYALQESWRDTHSMTAPAPIQSPGVADYVRDVVEWVDPTDPTKARQLTSRYLLEHVFAMTHQTLASITPTQELIKQAIEEAADDPSVPVNLDAQQIEALSSAVASKVERVTVIVDEPDAPA